MVCTTATAGCKPLTLTDSTWWFIRLRYSVSVSSSILLKSVSQIESHLRRCAPHFAALSSVTSEDSLLVCNALVGSAHSVRLRPE